MKNLKGKRALLTGAASGIGRALALELARQGVHLYLLDVDAAGLKATIDDCRSIGVITVGRRCDLSKPNEISAAVADLLARWQYVDLLVNNAGVAFYGPTEKMTGPQWDWLIAINLLAPLQITRELLPTLLSRGEAHILNVCSISGMVAAGRFAAYHVSKYGLVGFTEALRAEYNRRGLGVTNLCPGPVSSNLYSRAISGRENQPVPHPPRWLCATPERTARRGVRGIQYNKRLVLVTPLARILYWAKRLSPGLLDLLSRVGRRKKRAIMPVGEAPVEFDLEPAVVAKQSSQRDAA